MSAISKLSYHLVFLIEGFSDMDRVKLFMVVPRELFLLERSMEMLVACRDFGAMIASSKCASTSADYPEKARRLCVNS